MRIRNRTFRRFGSGSGFVIPAPTCAVADIDNTNIGEIRVTVGFGPPGTDGWEAEILADGEWLSNGCNSPEGVSAFGVTPGQTYQLHFRWLLGCNSVSDFGTPCSVVALNSPPVPVQLFCLRPGDGTEIDVGVNDFDLDATGIARVDVYRASRSDGVLAPFEFADSFDPKSNNFIANFSSVDFNYYYKFKSVGDNVTYAGESDFSDIIAALLEPQNFNISVEDDGSVVRFTWDYIGDPDGSEPSQDFQLQWSLVEDFSVLEGETNLPPAVSTNDVINGLTLNTTYYFRVRARDSNATFSTWTAKSVFTSTG